MMSVLNRQLGKKAPIICALLVVFSLLVAGRDATAAPLDGWKLTTDLVSRPKTLPCQPVRLKITLSYDKAEPFVGAFWPFSASGFVRITSKSGTETYHLYELEASAPPELPPPPVRSIRALSPTDIDLVLLMDLRKSRYLFEEPGDYSIRVGFPIRVASEEGKQEGRDVLSQPLRVQVDPLPEGERRALAMWRGRDRAKLLMAQTLSKRPFGAETPAGKALQALAKTYPRSTYTAAALPLLDAWKRAEPDDKVLLEDARLAKRVIVEFPVETPIADVIMALVHQSGVPLEVAPSVGARSLTCLKQEVELRSFMGSLASGGLRWVKQGKGYRLERDANAPK